MFKVITDGLSVFTYVYSSISTDANSYIVDSVLQEGMMHGLAICCKSSGVVVPYRWNTDNSRARAKSEQYGIVLGFPELESEKHLLSLDRSVRFVFIRFKISSDFNQIVGVFGNSLRFGGRGATCLLKTDVSVLQKPIVFVNT